MTGTSRGLGRALLDDLVAHAHHVVAAVRDPESLSAYAGNDHLLPVKVDVRVAEQILGAVDAALEAFGRIDVLVSSAGYGLLGPVEKRPPLRTIDYDLAPTTNSPTSSRPAGTKQATHVRVASVIRELDTLAEPPFRLQHGADCVARVEAKLDFVRTELDTWCDLAESTSSRSRPPSEPLASSRHRIAGQTISGLVVGSVRRHAVALAAVRK